MMYDILKKNNLHYFKNYCMPNYRKVYKTILNNKSIILNKII